MTNSLQFLGVCNTNFVTEVVYISKLISTFLTSPQTCYGNRTLQVRNKAQREWRVEKMILYFHPKTRKMAVRSQKVQCQWCFETHLIFFKSFSASFTCYLVFLVKFSLANDFFLERPNKILFKKNMGLRIGERDQIIFELVTSKTGKSEVLQEKVPFSESCHEVVILWQQV